MDQDGGVHPCPRNKHPRLIHEGYYHNMREFPVVPFGHLQEYNKVCCHTLHVYRDCEEDGDTI